MMVKRIGACDRGDVLELHGVGARRRPLFVSLTRRAGATPATACGCPSTGDIASMPAGWTSCSCSRAICRRSATSPSASQPSCAARTPPARHVGGIDTGAFATRAGGADRRSDVTASATWEFGCRRFAQLALPAKNPPAIKLYRMATACGSCTAPAAWRRSDLILEQSSPERQRIECLRPRSRTRSSTPPVRRPDAPAGSHADSLEPGRTERPVRLEMGDR